MLAKYRGTCKRTNNCHISVGDMVERYNGGWAHVLCHHKKGTLAVSSVRPVRCKAGWTVPDETQEKGFRTVQCPNEITAVSAEHGSGMCAACSDS